MMTRSHLLIETQKLLAKAEFSTSDPKDIFHASFDLVARRDDVILVLKVTLNADSISSKAVSGMLTLTRAVNGSAIIISARSGKAKIEDGVVYTRAGIPVISYLTFHDLMLEGIPPMVYAASGGLYAKLDVRTLKDARASGLSLGDLGEMGGVSRRTVKMYEEGMSAKVEVAIRIEEGLGSEVVVPINLFSMNAQNPVESLCLNSPPGLAGEVFDKLQNIGYSVDVAPRCPFDAVTYDDKVVLFTGIDKKGPGLPVRAKALANLSRILERHSVIFVDKLGERINLEGSPIVASTELSKIDNKKRMLELIEERG
jgi:putative transcriptional regulator